MKISREGRWLDPRPATVSGRCPRKPLSQKKGSQKKGSEKKGSQKKRSQNKSSDPRPAPRVASTGARARGDVPFDPRTCLENEPLVRGLDEQSLRRIAPDVPAPRRRLIARVRSEIRRGTYVTGSKLQAALLALLADEDR